MYKRTETAQLYSIASCSCRLRDEYFVLQVWKPLDTLYVHKRMYVFLSLRSSDILCQTVPCCGIVLGTVGCLPASLASTLWMTVAPHHPHDNENSRHCQMSPRRQIYSQLRTTLLDNKLRKDKLLSPKFKHGVLLVVNASAITDFCQSSPWC